ncbi:MAG: BatA domain-containing protein, partial [bacterium]
MNGLDFTHPGMLAALSAGVLPIVIHYLTRARPRRIRFPTFRFLVEAGSGRQAMQRLRDFILLLLRCLAVAALVGLFSRPFLRAVAGPKENEEKGTRLVVLVDASLSMRAARGGFSLFDRARAEAADVLRGLAGGSRAGVIFLGAKPRRALPELSPNLAKLHDALVKAEPTLERGEPLAALAAAREMLGGAGTIYVFSDFQRTNWSAVQFDRIEGVECVLRPVALRATHNVGVTDVELSPAEPVAGRRLQVTATIFNCSPQPRNATVSLDLETLSDRTTVALRPYSSTRATFRLQCPAAGFACGKVSLETDDLVEDDARYLRVRVRRALRVVVVSGASPDDVRSAAFYLSRAIRPNPSDPRGIELTTRSGQVGDARAIQAADAIVLASPVRLSPKAAKAITRRVSGGGRLLCWLDGPTARATVQALAEASDGAVAPPFKLLRPAAEAPGEGEPFARVRETADPLGLFADPAQGDLRGLRFRRHYLTEPAEGRGDEIVATFADGSAALSLGPAGRGRAAFANCSIGPDAGTLVRSPLFLPLVHEILRSLRRSAGGDDVTPGKPWHIDVPADRARGAGRYTVVGPDGDPAAFEAVQRDKEVRLQLEAAAAVGHYRA